MKYYVLLVNDQVYDDNEHLEVVEGWFDKFGAALKVGEVPHRWFNKFVQDGKLIHLTLEIKELDTDLGKRIKRAKF